MEELQSLLTSGAGLTEVLGRAAGQVGAALAADGVAIWRSEQETHLEAVLGSRPPNGEVLARVAEEARVLTSAGYLEDVATADPVAGVLAGASATGVSP